MKYTNLKSTTPDVSGFTIIELMIATVVFSVILLLVTTGLLQIGRNYYKGALQSRTQETARNIIDEISRGIQFSGEIVKPTIPQGASPVYTSAKPGSTYGFCVNGLAYAYVMDKQLTSSAPTTDQAKETLVSYPWPCSSFSSGTVKTPASAKTVAGSKELLGIGMRLIDLDVEPVPGSSDMYTIIVVVASGERDLFSPSTPPPAISSLCKIGAGQQYCAVSKLNTTVQKRIK